MSVKVYENGAWRDINSAKVYENGAWRDINSAKVYENGAWREVYPNLPDIGDGILCTYGNKVVNSDIVSLGTNTSIGDNYLYSPDYNSLNITFTPQYTLEVHADGSIVHIRYTYPNSSNGGNYSTDIALEYGDYGLPLGNTYRGTRDFKSSYYSTVNVCIYSVYKIYAVILRP